MESAPEPQSLSTSAEFVAMLRQLRRWAGLSLRDLERHASSAGESLPRATVSGVLNRTDLPREEFVATYVRACGGDPDAVDIWVSARRRLAVASEPLPTPAPITEKQTNGKAAQGTPEHDEQPTPAGNAAGGDGDRAGSSGSPSPDQGTPSDEQHEVGEADEAAGTAVTATASDVAQTGETAEEGTDARRGRRTALITALSIFVLLLAGTVTGIALLPDDGREKPKQVTPPKPPMVTTPRTPTPGGTAKPVTSKPSAPRDITTTPSPKQTPSKPPTPTPPVEDRPDPGSSSSEPTWPPHEPGPHPTDPPWNPSSPPADTSSPFPEETCWDVTNDCL
ncbi:helix-turn-helix domain-containing protein [Streptomyces inhibens]|uniref:helix-turn-helix domain-containing protein n=1 Tax=Streptomyces inhibens TaxID=2293571 RepID=UPI00402A7EB6